MPDQTLNEWIAEYLGWKPPGHEDTMAFRKRPRGAGRPHFTHECYDGDWLNPAGTSIEPVPLYDTDPAAAMGLLESVRAMSMDTVSGEYSVSLYLRKDGPVGRATSPTLRTAVAEAFAAAAGREASGG